MLLLRRVPFSTVQVKSSPCLVKYHVVKVYGEVEVQLVLIRGSRCRRVVNFMYWLPPLSHAYSVRGCWGSRVVWTLSRREKPHALAKKPRFLGHLDCSPFSLHTADRNYMNVKQCQIRAYHSGVAEGSRLLRYAVPNGQ
jgi:hypothetical protein